MNAKEVSTHKRIIAANQKMLDQGMTQKQIEEKLGLTRYRPVHELLKRERKKGQKSHLPKQRGRRPAKTLQEYKRENERLRSEDIRDLRGFPLLKGSSCLKAIAIKHPFLRRF